ncbi:MAG: hypothetical protein GEU78_18850 [Actinobacteria bacterium]|nr:hypothetical protein [Actinomycetota bacterium]
MNARASTKIVGRLPGEHSCLPLVWAVLKPCEPGGVGRGARQAPASVRMLQRMRDELFDPANAEEVIEASFITAA